jgi:hypothetical protein
LFSSAQKLITHPQSLLLQQLDFYHEMERPDMRERRISFNPEAVAFSPTTASARAAGVFSVPFKHDEMAHMALEDSAILDGTFQRALSGYCY